MSETVTQTQSLREQISDTPRPALLWVLGLVVLLGLEMGALADMTVATLSAIAGVVASVATTVLGGPVLPGVGSAVADGLASASQVAAGLPDLVSRSVVPNQGYQTPDGVWHGTFLGLEPKIAWLLRVALVYGYLFVVLWWLWRGYRTYVNYYRTAEWTPRDDMVRRLRTHSWGKFGMVIVILFVGMAMFAPTVSPSTADQNMYNMGAHEIQYYSEETGSVESITVLQANFESASQGSGSANVGPGQYDDFGRFHPFGTLTSPGQDLFTFMAYGARISLLIGVVAIGIALVLAAGLGMVTAYYKGLTDLTVVFVSDTIQSLPSLLLLMLASMVFGNHWLGKIYNGGLLLAVMFGIVYFPNMWRSIRGPALQVAEEEWVDAAKSYGQRSSTTMRKHMLPYILGYLLIYGSMSIGGVIIGTAGLTFLGFGINPPIPEWGRAISMGQAYVTTPAWHISLLPGLLIVVVVTGFNALGDGIRDAMDPESEGEDTSAGVGATGGGA